MQKIKPELSFWQIWNMCFGFLGIQFGFALQNANVSRIFQTLGADMDNIPILWIAAPVTGLIVQPIIGYMSDNTWNRLGRRRPYFLYGAIVASLALFVMPNSPSLWIAAGMLWVMDASINVSMEPFRAFVGDMLPRQQRPSGYAMQSFFIGVGAVVASALPWMMSNWFGVSNVAEAGMIPDTVKFAFYAGAAVFILAVGWTVYSTKEYSPQQLQAFEDAELVREKLDANLVLSRPAATYFKQGLLWLFAGSVIAIVVAVNQLDKQLFILAAGLALFGVCQFVAGRMAQTNHTSNGFAQVMNDLFVMPDTMKQLAWVQFFSWFALFAMWIYTTAAVTSHHYGTTDTATELYNEGANWVGLMFAAYNGFAAIAAIVIPFMIRMTNLKVTHQINLVAGGLSLIAFLFIQDPVWLMVPMVGIGFVWASILSLPYALLSNALPVKKMGVFMGIFNFFIVIPQILAASVLGFLVKSLFDNDPIYALLLGGISFFIAAVLVWRVTEND
ncbi:MFS transporter [Neptunicella sp. SCSIO 80796]|uniref:MFS transporter n=1 Tax=Neptunicella plasticusilytica TaxID=3117012 RepID=UPI003A4D879F